MSPRFTATASGLQSAPFDLSWTRESPPGAGDPYVIEVTSSITVGTSTSTTETATPPAGTQPGTSSSSGSTPSTTTGSAPDTKILGAKIDSATRTATFRFKAPGKGTKLECELSGKGKAKYKSCTSPETYRKLEPGHYVFSVRARGSGKSGPTVKRPFSIGRR
jgi:hypothetical protein